MRGRTESKRRCSVYPVLFPTPSNSSLHGRSWRKMSLSLSLFFLFLLFLLRFCYPHWPTGAVRSAIFSFSFLPPFFFFFLKLYPHRRANGGLGVFRQEMTKFTSVCFRAIFTHTKAGNDRFNAKRKTTKE